MALSQDQLLGLYIAIPIYFVLLGGCTFWARRRMKKLVHDKVSDQLSAHYLGGRTFGPVRSSRRVAYIIYIMYDIMLCSSDAFNHIIIYTIRQVLTAGTVFASIFSGYTVVGIPNEAYTSGWEALRWIPFMLSIFVGYWGTALRLRKASNIRNHQTPGKRGEL